MTKSKFENEKFILDFSYNEKLEKFEEIKYTEKNLNELENKILKEVCLLIPKCNLQELYEHLIIRVENKLRDFKKTNYSGIIFAENLSDEYRYFKKFFREFFKPYIKKNLHTKVKGVKKCFGLFFYRLILFKFQSLIFFSLHFI